MKTNFWMWCFVFSFGLLSCYSLEFNGALVFFEDFEGDTLRKYFWEREEGCEELRHSNMKRECFLEGTNNLEVANGTLILKAGMIKFDDKVMYTTARVRGSGFGFKYGTYMIRARLPNGKHLLPAFYLLPLNQHLDECKYEEIDIMEYRGQRPSSLVFAAKYGRRFDALFTKSISRVFKNVDFSQDFHVFAIKWKPTRIEWFVDDIKVHEVNTHFITDWTNGNPDNLPCTLKNVPPFSQKSGLILSLAVGGKLFPSKIFGNLTEDEAKQWKKPSVEIDWVKVYNDSEQKQSTSS